MNAETFNEVMDELPNAFPTSRITMTDGIKEAYWKDLKGYEDADFLSAIAEIRRRGGKFPDLPVLVTLIESIRKNRSSAELDRRMEEHYRKKKQQPLSYAPADPGDKQLKIDTFAMIRAGVMSGDMPAALRKLGEKYPGEKWIPRLIEEMAREKVMGAIETIST